MNFSADCEQVREELVLLRYPDELTPAGRARVLEHLDDCEDCRHLRDELEEAAANLDALPLERPDSQRFRSLKQEVLSAVGATCLAEPEVYDDVTGPDPAHLADCRACQTAADDREQVAAALDCWALELPAEGLANLKQRVLDEVGVGRPRAGLLLGLRPALPTLARLAAVLLVGVLMGAGGMSWLDQPPPPALEPSEEELTRLKHLLDVMRYQGDFEQAEAVLGLFKNKFAGSTDLGQEFRFRLKNLEDMQRLSPHLSDQDLRVEPLKSSIQAPADLRTDKRLSTVPTGESKPPRHPFESPVSALEQSQPSAFLSERTTITTLDGQEIELEVRRLNLELFPDGPEKWAVQQLHLQNARALFEAGHLVDAYLIVNRGLAVDQRSAEADALRALQSEIASSEANRQ